MFQFQKISIIFKEFIKENPKSFLLLFSLLLIEGLLLASTVLAVIPLADFLFDSELKSPSKVTLFIQEKFLLFGIPNNNFWSFGLFFAFLNILSGGAKVCIRFAILNIKYSILRNLQTSTLQKFFSTRWSFYSGESHGKILNTMQKELNTVGDTIGAIATQFAQLIQFFVYVSIPLFLNMSMTITAMLIAFSFGILFLRLNKYSYKLGKMNTATANIMMGVLNEILQSARIILGFGNQKEARIKYLKTFDDHIAVTIKSQVLLDMIPNFFKPLGILAAVIAFGVALNLGGRVSELAAVLWSLLNIMPILSSFLHTSMSISNFIPSYEQLTFLRERAEEHKEIEGSNIFKGLKDEIRFENVYFSYPGSKNTITNLDLTIKKGQITALIGESGSGKSTITDLVLGLQIPSQGSIFIDEFELKDYQQNSFRNKVGYVPQDPVLFHSSVRENLLWSNKSSSEKELWNALDIANAASFVKKLPQGIDTIVGDRGTRLSGGQRQRIALARALLRKPELLILDEATSALDSESEKLIKKSIEDLPTDTTILIVAHRLSTINNADRVCVLDSGKIIESGSYSELNSNPKSILYRK